MRNTIPEGDIRVGVLGAFRGKSFAKTAAASGMKLVAICDNFKHRLDEVCNELNVPGYENFDEFIHQDFDAVVIAAPFHTHAHFAKLALKAGKHVLTETSTNVTLAEGVEVYRLAKETDLCYMLAENYCYTRFSQEFKRLYDAGEIGEVRYAEGQYNHPMDIEHSLWYSPGTKHWRNWLPGCYYNTHSLAPLMYVTGTMPVAVSCSQFGRGRDGYKGRGYVMLIKMDNGAIFRTYGGAAGHDCAYSFHGTVGAMECVRGHGYFGPEEVRVWHEPWDLKPGQQEEVKYFPRWVEHAEEANKTGHGGGDFFVELKFAEAIRTGVQPYLDTYHGITMSNVGILAWRSAHQDGKFIEIPDIRDEKVQQELLKDRLSPFVNPFPGEEDNEQLPENMCCKREFTPEIIKIAREQWARQGYTESEIDELLRQ